MTVIEATPRRATVAVIALTVVAAALFALGWLVGKVSIPLGWMLAAVRIGWTDARRGRFGR